MHKNRFESYIFVRRPMAEIRVRLDQAMRVHKWARKVAQLSSYSTPRDSKNVVISCSALRRSYRDHLRALVGWGTSLA